MTTQGVFLGRVRGACWMVLVPLCLPFWGCGCGTAARLSDAGRAATGGGGQPTGNDAAVPGVGGGTPGSGGRGGSSDAGVGPVDRKPLPPRETITVKGVPFPKEHPRLWFGDVARVDRAQAYLAANPYKPTAPKNSGDYQPAMDLAFMHVMTGADCTPSINWALNFQKNSGYVPKPSDAGSDQVRWAGESIALVYDWCNDQMTPSQRTTYVESWNTWFGNVKQQAWGGGNAKSWMTESNYFWGNLRNEMEWGIATYGENTEAETFLDYAVNTRWAAAVKYFGEAGRGGVCSEGMDYGATLLRYPQIPMLTAAAGGRNLFAESDRFQTAVYWLLYAGLPATTYNIGTKQNDWQWFTFNDDEHAFWGNGNRQRVDYYGDFMTEAVSIWPSTAGRYAQAWLNQVSPEKTLISAVAASQVAPESMSTLPLDYYASGAGYLYGRNQWGGQSTVFHLQMGRPLSSAAGHLHWDAGNFQIWRKGRWLAREAAGYATTVPGYKNGAAEDASYGIAHNIALVNGLGPVGWHYAELGAPVVRRMESQASYVYGDVELTDYYQINQQYPTYANRALVSIEREYLFVRALESMVILDRIQMQSPDGGKTPASQVPATWVMHSETAPTVEDPNHLLVVNGDQALRVTTLLPKAGGTSRQIAEPKSFVIRTELDQTGGSTSVCNSDKACLYFLTVLQARDATAPNLTASVVDANSTDPTTGTLTLTLHPNAGSDAVIVFQKGMQSSGGTITINKVESSLRKDVQSISYTEKGPVWKQ